MARWQEAYDRSVMHLTYAASSTVSLKTEIQNLKELNIQLIAGIKTVTENSAAKIKEAEEGAAHKIAEMEKILTAARESSSKTAVAVQASEFESEAKKSLVASHWWLGATLLVVSVSLCLVYWMFLRGIHETSIAASGNSIATSISSSGLNAQPIANTVTPAVLEKTIARILIITLLYSAVVWCARNYFACRHNHAVNRHRRNAMQTFKTFIAGTEDKSTKDFILRQVAACAFAPQQSGYLKDESLPIPAPASQIVDIVRPTGG